VPVAPGAMTSASTARASTGDRKEAIVRREPVVALDWIPALVAWTVFDIPPPQIAPAP
jgi:hypothetical protein